MKTMLITLLLALSFTGCGDVHLKSDPIKVEGNVTHTVVIDATQLAAFYKAYCESKAENQTQAEIDACVTESLALFWNAVNLSAPAGSVSQSN